MGDGTIKGWFLVAVIMTFALIPFFAYRELNRALGESELRALLFGRGDQKP
jgi:cbb3-type cytochrome oxidase subunit 3